MLKTYWHSMPSVPTEDVIGKLIVLEGTDGVGRSTQIELLKNSLESSGLAVYDTGLTRSNLAGRDLQQAKEGHTMGAITQALYYATDFADRLLNEMIPALRAGYVVLTDRYIYSLMARAIVRGADPQWIRHVYGFAVVPDLVLYLQADLQTLIPRVLASGGFDYWESGADYVHGDSRYDCFVQHQDALLGTFSQMVDEYGFVVVNANRSVKEVSHDLRRYVGEAVADIQSGACDLPLVESQFSFSRPAVGGGHPSTRTVSDIIADLLSTLQDE